MPNLTEENNLKNFAKNHNIATLSSEDILKLTILQAYALEEIALAFNTTKEEIQKIKKAKGLKNMILESKIRDIETLLNYIDTKNQNISNNIREKIISILIHNIIPTTLAHRDFYIKQLIAKDFSRQNILQDLKTKQIDQEYRLNELKPVLPFLEYQIKKLIEEGLNNKFQTQISDHPEMLMYFTKNENRDLKNINNYEYDKISQELVGAFPSNSKKNAKKENNKDEITIEINGEAQTYNIQFTEEKYFIPAKKTTRKHKGAIHNYTKENKTKKEHGNIGEQIALEAEKMRLIKMGLEDYVDDVILISKIDEETTFDGLGFDILSYNENLERVCIEVKTTFSTKDRPFYITPKEIEILKGAKEEFDCKHTLMYYLLINDHDVTIKKIKSLDFAQINLETVLYKVKDTEKQAI